MGMYNECYKRCPECGGTGTAQVRQIVLGFGEFNLDDPAALAERLDESELLQLAAAVKDATFKCEDCDNRYSFNSTEDENKRLELATRLFAE